MVTSRGAFFLGLSLIICVAMLIYGPQIGKFRYLTVPTNQGLFILDTKTQMMNVCTDKTCRIVPHEASGPLAPGTQPTYGQMQMAPVSSLGIIDNTNHVGGFSCGNGMCIMPMPQQPQIVQMQQPKPEVIIEQHTAPLVQEMLEPRPQPIKITPERMEPRPAIIQPARPMTPTPQIPMTRPPAPMPTALTMQPRPISAPIAQAMPAMERPNPAEAQVLADERSLAKTEQELGLSGR